MSVDFRKFFRATDPGKTLFVENCEADHQYYIDFSAVRGGQIVENLRDNISLWSPDRPTCQLFTGHIGCGKSTELLRLKADLECQGFHVVYFDSSRELEMGDVDVGDILLAIALKVSQSLDNLTLKEPKGLKTLLQGAAKLLQTEIDLDLDITGEFPGGQISANTQGEVSGQFLVPGIGTITAKAKASPDLRAKLRGYLEPRTNGILEAINQELLEPAHQKLAQHGKKGLVVIIDSLDRVDSSPKPWGRPQHEYLFVDRGEQLRGLHCHIVYTIPLALRFSNDFDTLMQRLASPQVLPMVPVQYKDGRECTEGMQLLRQMVLARAFPELAPHQRLEKISAVFDSLETLDRLCRVSGGHVRNLLRMLNDGIKKQRGVPICRDTIEQVIRTYRNQRILAITNDEWVLLRQVARQKTVAGSDGYTALIRSMFVYEYCDDEAGSWFDVNPILAEAKELR
ncbi:ATP-binding protein [Phormidium sp. CCY1219]|uniref:ATP-binding protein n=1 Tax=Phormidium sp. CCY1219 TaxID=2886104 RepID=UPI002D1E4D2B|nr:ATP-binding protein [Phormidium sp. CCY1219]MEB3827745.1 AAA family ATPase [Phormidium sp. CCY1219]